MYYKTMNVKLLGEGACGKVYLVQTGTQKFVLKRIYAREEDYKKQCLKEVEILSELEHPNIVKYIRHFYYRPYLYIVMEYIQGEVLSDLKEIPDDYTIISWTFQLLLALRYLRSKKIIHRDIKPSNILVNKNGLIKIIDFGLSKKLNFRFECIRGFLGTPMYLAPQIAKKYSYGLSVDLWSLGATIYEIATRKCLIQGVYYKEQFYQELIKKDPIELSPYLSPQIKKILLMMLQKDPSQRVPIDKILVSPTMKKFAKQFLDKGLCMFDPLN